MQRQCASRTHQVRQRQSESLPTTCTSSLLTSCATLAASCTIIISVDSDCGIASRLVKAGCAFGKLQRRLWGVHDVSMETKIDVYEAVVLTTLLYGCETWTLYRRPVRRVDQFHLRCLRKIAGVKYGKTGSPTLKYCIVVVPQVSSHSC